MKMAGGALVFLAELGMLVGLAWWGLLAFDGAASWAVGVGLPVVVMVVWSVFLAPKAVLPPPRPVQISVRLLLLLTGAAAYWAVGVPALAGLQALLAVGGTVMAARGSGPDWDELEARRGR
ncbi:DUF2568 domain-containing protein [Demequina sp. NBRC 110057]|uniref:DUF2568 domain-containing protein n=1 Tax=Demequina sp. NBRC 110057 TaxID=1570346 RepID=UPI0013566ACE|nr:DUF2568 domain-containing protein [Demequina sp. NBRC 110057]